jgi:tol-pal system protein YbgF
MKKIILLATCSLILACGSQDEVIKKSISSLNEEIISLQKTVADLKVNIDELERKNQVNKENIETNATAITNLKTDIIYLSNNKSAINTQKNKVSETNDSNKNNNQIIVISDDSYTDKSSLYSAAYEAFKDGNYFESRKKFENFLKLYPNDDLSDNALYWISESYYSEKNYQKSIEILERLLKDYPYGNKVPDATLKMALSYHELGNNDKAVEILNKLISDFPDSNVAQVAKNKLSEWGY